MSKLFILLVVIVGVFIYIKCGNTDFSNKTPNQKMVDSAIGNEGKKKEIIIDNETNSLINYNIKNIINIQNAYAFEIIESAKYKDFSRNAALEGFNSIALLYKAVSLSESIHANNHKAVLLSARAIIPKVKIAFEINNTQQNLEKHIKAAANEVSNSYPKYIQIAEKAGNKMAQVSLTYAMKTEKMQLIYYKIALENLVKKTEKSFPKTFYICPTCGNTFMSSAPDRCEFSLTKADKFIKINSLQ